jgi:ligand-binding sensor domain-containing protein/signal transduction histidine kinase
VLSVGLLLACSRAGVSANSASRQVVRLPFTDGAGLRFAHVSFGEGPSRSNIRQIVQDDQGFLWFGTQDGLKRYDGYRFREYRYQEGTPNGLSGTSVTALFKDRAGFVWVGSDRYLDRYDPATERFTAYASDANGSRIFAGGVNQIAQDADGAIWLSTTEELCRLDLATGKTVHYYHRAGDSESLSGSHVKSTFVEKDGTFWVVTTEGLDVMDRHTGRVTSHIQLHTPVSMSEVGLPMHLFQDHSGVLWLTFPFGNGLAAVDRQAKTLTRYSFRDGASESSIEAIHEDEEGGLWLASSENGLLKLDRGRNTFIRFRNSASDPDSLSSNQVHALFEDREGNIWVGTQGGGINRFAGRPAPFSRYRHEPGNPNSLEKDEVTSVYEDSQGILWVGNRVALNRIDRRTGQFTIYRNSGGPRNLSNTYVLSIAEDRTGHLWFGTSGGGLNRLDRRTGEFRVFRHHPGDPGSLSHDIVYCLFVDRHGTLWAGTDDGLDRYDPATERFQAYRVAEAGMSSYRVIAEDATGGLWLGTLADGLHRFDAATGRFAVYRHASAAGSLSNNWVNAVCVDHSGTVWAGTLSGLNSLDLATGVFHAYYERDGLPNSNLSGILEDRSGDLWLATNKGLSRFTTRTGKFRNYYASDGIAGNEFFRRNGASKSASGEMFFSSPVGLTAFFPERVVESSFVPPVVLTDLLLADKTANIGGGSPLSRSISLTRSLTLGPEQNIFSFEFSALSYASPERNKYRYRLEGLETAWNERDSHHRTATYTTLPSGDYTFRVQGSNNRGVWNETGASIQIRILPPWWRTLWFTAAAAACFLAVLWYGYHYRLQQIARQLNVRFEERLAERTRIARELHDTLLQGFLSASMQLHVATDRLSADSPAKPPLNRILELMSGVIEEGRNAVRGLRLSDRDSLDLEPAFSLVARELAIHERMRFRVVVEGIPRPLHPVVRDEIYRIGREALINAFRHSGAGSIEVELEYTHTRLRVAVRDDGCGIEDSVLRSGRDGHWGLPGMHERAERIGAHLRVWSRAAAGTEAELCVPAHIAFRAALPNRVRERCSG